jgi:hypothetical protein
MNFILRVFTPLAAALVLAGCSGSDDSSSSSNPAATEQAFRVVSPAPEAAYSSAPAEFSIVLPEGFSSEDVEIDLNDANIRRVFAIRQSGEGVTFTARGADLSDLLKPGENVLWVRAGLKYQRISFFIDNQAPELHVISVDAQNRTVTGYLKEPSGTQSFTLNGSAVPLQADGRFTATYADQPFNTFKAMDTLGHQMSVTYANDAPGTIGVRLNQTTFNQLSPLIAEQFAAIDLNSLIAGIGRISLSSSGLTNLNLELTGVQLSSPEVNLNVLDTEELKAQLDFSRIEVGFKLTGRYLVLPFETSGTISFSDFNAQTLLDLALEGDQLAGNLSNTQVSLGRPKVDLNPTGLISAITNLITQPLYTAAISSVQPKLQTSIAQAVEQSVNPAFDQLANLLNYAPVNQPGAAFAVSATPKQLDFKNRGLNLFFDASVFSNLTSNAPSSLGYIYRPESSLSLTSTSPSGVNFDVAATLSANSINQALFEINDAYLTNQSYDFPIGDLDADALGADAEATDAPEAQDQIRVAFNPVSAPFVELKAGSGATGSLIWRDVDLKISQFKPRWSEFRPRLDIRADLQIDFEVVVSAQNQISLRLTSLPKVQVTESRKRGWFGFSANTVDYLVNYSIDKSLPGIQEQIQIIDLPLAGGPLSLQSIWTTGSLNNTLVFAGKINP